MSTYQEVGGTEVRLAIGSVASFYLMSITHIKVSMADTII
jgi:hypothetical protein